MAMEPSYQEIIGLGPVVLPLILRELAREPDQWFWALRSISGEDPAADAETVQDASQLWLRWGRERGLLR